MLTGREHQRLRELRAIVHPTPAEQAEMQELLSRDFSITMIGGDPGLPEDDDPPPPLPLR